MPGHLLGWTSACAQCSRAACIRRGRRHPALPRSCHTAFGLFLRECTGTDSQCDDELSPCHLRQRTFLSSGRSPLNSRLFRIGLLVLWIKTSWDVWLVSVAAQHS